MPPAAREKGERGWVQVQQLGVGIADALLEITFVVVSFVAAGLVAAGVVAGAGPLALLSDETSTESETTATDTTTDTSSTEPTDDGTDGVGTHRDDDHRP